MATPFIPPVTKSVGYNKRLNTKEEIKRLNIKTVYLYHSLVLSIFTTTKHHLLLHKNP